MTINNDNITIDPDATYPFNVTDITIPSYKFTTSISEWLVTNLTSLTDKNDNPLFHKVNTGFNESTLKTFSGKPTCDVYINSVDYDSTFDWPHPETVHTIILFYLKGANNTAYSKCCELHDYLMQEFIENENFRCLDEIVENTIITNSQLMMQPINKKWGVMGALELAHKIIY